MSAYALLPATPDDAEAIARLFALSWQSPFTQLQFGKMSTDVLASAMAPRIVESMSKAGSEYVLMRAEDGTVAAVAQWSVPVQSTEDSKKDESPEEKAERLRKWDERYRGNLPESSNKDLIMEFTAGLRELRDDVLQGREHFLLENLATHPDHRRRGLASRLIEWVLPQADRQKALVYLDTASDNEAMRIYKNLGFEEGGSDTIENLERFGGEGSHTHVALVRRPLSAEAETSN